MSKRLSEIRHRSNLKDRKATKEGEWLAKMEAAALKDYRDKDLGQGSDLSARIFNEKKAERDRAREEAERQRLREEGERPPEHQDQSSSERPRPQQEDPIGP